MEKRPVSKKFIELMEEKLEEGRCKSYTGWDEHWEYTITSTPLCGVNGYLFQRLLQEVVELGIAIEKNENVASEAADIANFAMMIADLQGDIQL